MTITFLKKAKDLTPQNSIKYWLHQHLSRIDDGRPLSRMHASELTRPEGLCPRMYAIADLTKTKPKDEWLNASSFMTFQIGRDQEKNIVLWFAEMNKAVCHWKCVACGTVHKFTMRPHACKSCGTKKFDPQEVRFESAITGVSCGVDMLVAMGGPKLRPVELKTIDKDEFKNLKAPLAEHKWRTQLYLRTIDECTDQNASHVGTDKATILYVSKGGFGCADPELKKWGLQEGFSPFKEFEITRDDKATEPLAERAKVVKDFRDGKVGMPCGLCPSSMSQRAKGCIVKKHCFSGDFPPTYDWKA
ncbi:hypothetical protein [Hyphomicrobium sp.]|uniref:hypothetical protein n=1 Tax=Hyphomicrobium sp. TaxID=82 RepID=UPI001D4B1485|nr:hypothetical protein [Hyphomicrobium sp.]MBY0560038.1 hypothetical protein [Hyphomicrobium sp.]